MKFPLANIITFLRIPLIIATLFVSPFSVAFWCFYLSSGLTDVIDGFIARKLNQDSALGAKLDSIADFIFAVVLAIFVIKNIKIPVWLWVAILIIACIRFFSYAVGLLKFHSFVSLHTIANKITGILIFLAPIFFKLFGFEITFISLCVIGFLSAIEELFIIFKSKTINRNCKSIFEKQ